MKPVQYLFLAVIAALTFSGCARKSVVSSSGGEYREDLSSVRPKYEYVEPVFDKPETTRPEKAKNTPKTPVDKPLYVNKKLDTVLDTLARHNKGIRYINGFRIQIYVGNVRQEADGAKSYVYQAFPDLNPYVSYNQPTYRVKVGDFMYRADAEHYLEQIKEQYASAVILADRVEIKRSLAINPVSDN